MPSFGVQWRGHRVMNRSIVRQRAIDRSIGLKNSCIYEDFCSDGSRRLEKWGFFRLVGQSGSAANVCLRMERS